MSSIGFLSHQEGAKYPPDQMNNKPITLLSGHKKRKASKENTSTMKKSSNEEAASKIGDMVLLKNNQFIVFNKPPGLAVQSAKQEEKNLCQLSEIYCKCKTFPAHRIDQPVSGIVLFAKTLNAFKNLSEQFKQRSVSKKYLAVVQNNLSVPEGELIHYLEKKGKGRKTKIADTPFEGGKHALLRYKVIGAIDHYQLLEIDLETGRQHQIRAQLAYVGAPIKGDVKYGFKRGNLDRSIHLHAWKISFRHPVTHETIEVEAPPPVDPVWQAFFPVHIE